MSWDNRLMLCNNLKIRQILSLLYYGLDFCLEEAGRVEDSTFKRNTMQVHRR